MSRTMPVKNVSFPAFQVETVSSNGNSLPSFLMPCNSKVFPMMSDFPVDCVRNDGSEFPLELTVSTWKAGKETFFTSIFRDINQSKRAEEEIQGARVPLA